MSEEQINTATNIFWEKNPKFCVTPGQLKIRPSQKIFHFGLFEPTNTFFINPTRLTANLRSKCYIRNTFQKNSIFLCSPGTLKNKNFPVNLHLYIWGLIRPFQQCFDRNDQIIKKTCAKFMFLKVSQILRYPRAIENRTYSWNLWFLINSVYQHFLK